MNNIESFKQKYLKYKTKYLQLKKQLGGYIINVDLRRIRLTPAIYDYIREHHPDIDLGGYILVPRDRANEFGGLTRMDLSHMGRDLRGMMQQTREAFIDLLQRDPVELDQIPIEVRDADGEKHFEYEYSIRNGRHRITRAIIEGLTRIRANV